MQQIFTEGELIEAVRGRRRVTDVATRGSGPFFYGLHLGEPGLVGLSSIDSYLKAGFTLTVIEKATPPLPTESGWYESEEFPLGTTAGYEPYSLNTDGKWYTADGQLLTPTDLRELGNLSRLEPVPVTAKKVLDAIRRRIGSIDSAYDFQAVAATFGVSE